MTAQRVITYQSPATGERIYLCEKHQGITTRDSQGVEHCQVHRGLSRVHGVACEICSGDYMPDGLRG